MKKIIACTDFSANARIAVDYAFSLAQHYHAAFILLHSFLVPVPVSELPPSAAIYHEAEKQANDYADRLIEELEKVNVNKIAITKHIENENLLLCLEELTAKIQPDLVVVGTRGERDMVDVLVGSNTIKVINHLNNPVMVIPSNARFHPYEKIGFACDFEKVVETTPVDLIKKLVTDFNSQLFVINVDYHNKHFTPQTPEESMLLDHLLFKLKPRYEFLEGKDLAEEIDYFARKNNLDLLITIPKKHSFFERFFKGTNTRRLIYQSNIPLLCVPEK